MLETDRDGKGICAVSLRSATLEDEQFLQQLFATTRADELALMPWNENQKQSFIAVQFKAQSQQYAMAYPHADYSIILLGDVSIGRMIVDRNEAATSLVDIALLPSYRNTGIGTGLIKDLLKEAAAAGKPVRLHVLTSSAAKRLYERLGFSQVGSDAVYLEMKWVPSVFDPDE